METKEFEYNGHTATVILPDRPNGKWIWKTEFLYAFDSAERDLSERGYTRVYYGISHRYGSFSAVRLMHGFHLFLTREYGLDEKAILFGFSRGGLYAFNYALFYPEYVSKVYLDAPVLDMKTWPPTGSDLQKTMFREYSLNADTLASFDGNPSDRLSEYFSLGIPTLLVAGDSDETVPFESNAKKMIDFCAGKSLPFEYYVKPGGGHHPHSLEDVSPILRFVTE